MSGGRDDEELQLSGGDVGAGGAGGEAPGETLEDNVTPAEDEGWQP